MTGRNYICSNVSDITTGSRLAIGADRSDVRLHLQQRTCRSDLWAPHVRLKWAIEYKGNVEKSSDYRRLKPELWAAKRTLLHASALLLFVLSSQVSCGLRIRT
jgi:hypothetical protein